jgi:hypothetical protein
MALAHQMYPQRTKYFLEAYTAATAQPHGYLVIDMKQETPDILRLRSSIFPGEETFDIKSYRHTHTDSRRDCDRLW